MSADASPGSAESDPTLSIVIPMLDEERNVEPLFERLFDVLSKLERSCEVIVVDDGSTDGTLARLCEQKAHRGELRIISFARNFGQHAAVMAGFEAARGDFVVTLDADLQNPPEEIPELVRAFDAGHDLVNTYRLDRQDSGFRRVASRLVNALVRRASGIAVRDFGCMLRGYSKEVVEQMVRQREFQTFIPALASLYARNPIEIPVSHALREHGRSAYSLWRLFALQLDLVTSFSIAPLRTLFVVGTGIAALGVCFGALLLGLRLLLGAEWAGGGVFTIFAVLFFFVGAQFVAFGLLGEYVGRIYQEVRHRPLYVLRARFSAAREGYEPDRSEGGVP